MIDLQSPLTGVAEPPSVNQRSTIGMSSPGGEETGEGELNLRERSECHFLCCSVVETGEGEFKLTFHSCSNEGELNHRRCQFVLILRLYLSAIEFPFKLAQGHLRLLKAIQRYSITF
jgi:hypothetical protein